MKNTDNYVPSFVKTFPSPMERGVLYISTEFSLAGHICPSGCGSEVVTKLSPARYKVIYNGEISLRPSVAATGLPCNSHYFITRGKVDWQPKLTPDQADFVRASDRKAVNENRDADTISMSQRIRQVFNRILNRYRH